MTSYTIELVSSLVYSKLLSQAQLGVIELSYHVYRRHAWFGLLSSIGHLYLNGRWFGMVPITNIKKTCV